MNTIQRRNIGIVAHVDAGKTTITEHILYHAGIIRAMGNVDKGTTKTDSLEVERERGISVLSATTTLHWKGITINLIDTPGHQDFSGEVERSLSVLDSAILVISAVEGIQAHTETLWNALRKLNIPTIVFINKIDRVGSDTSRLLGEIQEEFTENVLSFQSITDEGTDDANIVSIMDNQLMHQESFAEFLADRDEDVLTKYLNEESIPVNYLEEKLIGAIHNCKIYPILYGAVKNDVGVIPLLDTIIKYLPNPSGSIEAPLSGVIYKIQHDKTMGKIASVRLYNGILKNRDMVTNATQNANEKVTQIRKISAQKYEDVGILHAGDIGAVCGFSHAKIGDILGEEDSNHKMIKLAQPLMSVKVNPEDDKDYTNLISALRELTDEDPLLDFQWTRETRELHVKIMGLIQMQILTSILKNRFDIAVKLDEPSIIYKETPSKRSYGYASYTMPKPCWAVVKFLIEPGERGSGIAFESKVGVNDILQRYQNEIEKTIPKTLKQGIKGWEVTDLKITLIEGEDHVVHTRPSDFCVATPMALMEGLVNTDTTLLEPILSYRITIPEKIIGKVLSTITVMRGSFDTPINLNGRVIIEGTVPAATFIDFPIALADMSSGKGRVSVNFLEYREVPLELGKTRPYRGISPLDRSKWILQARGAM